MSKKDRLDSLNNRGTMIFQNDQFFSFSTDAILLSRFASIPKSGKIVDLCAGNGAIALNIADLTKANITLIELQEELAQLAQKSINFNNFQNQLSIMNINLNNSLNFISHDSIDSIVCNPPYFKASKKSNQNPNQHLAIARHELKTNFDEICFIASKLLKTKGHFNLVHRPDRFLEIISTLQKYNLTPKRIQFVYPNISKEANMLLIDAIKGGSTDGIKFLPPLYIYDQNGNYTKEVLKFYDQ